MEKGETKAGFTIIEVALVIAIAGLIFLMIFVALPWLRASQRDTKRREDLIHFIGEIKTFQQKNRGALPGTGENPHTITWSNASSETNPPSTETWAGFYRDYLKDNYMDPDGEYYKLDYLGVCNEGVTDKKCSGVSDDMLFPNDYKIVILSSAVCKGNDIVQSGNHRKLAIMYALESGGVYCTNT